MAAYTSSLLLPEVVGLNYVHCINVRGEALGQLFQDGFHGVPSWPSHVYDNCKTYFPNFIAAGESKTKLSISRKTLEFQLNMDLLKMVSYLKF